MTVSIDILERTVAPVLSDDVLAVSIVNSDGNIQYFKSEQGSITQQSLLPLVSIVNISKFLHLEVTGEKDLKKLYVYISGDKHDYLIYPINDSYVLVLFVGTLNKNKINTLLSSAAEVAVQLKKILK